MPLISAWKAGWGKAHSDNPPPNPHFSDKDLEAPASTAVSKRSITAHMALEQEILQSAALGGPVEAPSSVEGTGDTHHGCCAAQTSPLL